MMGVSGTSTPISEVGVISLAIFLADVEGCKARLAELRAAADTAEQAQTAAMARSAAADTREAEAASLLTSANDAVEKAAAGMKVVQSEQIRLKALETALDARSAEVVTKEAAQEKRAAELVAETAALVAREATLAISEASVVAMRQDYEAKLAKLAAIVA